MDNNTNNVNNTGSENNGRIRRRNPNPGTSSSSASSQNENRQPAIRSGSPPSLNVRRTTPQKTGQTTGGAKGRQDAISPLSASEGDSIPQSRRNVRRMPTYQQGRGQPMPSRKGTQREEYAGTVSDEDSKTRISAVIPRAAADAARPQRSSSKGKGTPDSRKKKKGAEHKGSMMSGLLKGIIYIVVVLVVAAFSAYSIIAVGNDIFAFVKATDIYEIDIPENADVDVIADLLKENNIIRYPSVFKLYAKYKKDSGNFIAGIYEINPSMNYDELLRAFKPRYTRETIWISIPEGFTVDEIISLFVSNGIGSREGFVEAINNHDYDYKFIDALNQTISPNRSYRLEGYLFPDTYQFYTDNTEVEIVRRLLTNFERKFNDAFYGRAEELGYTVDEVIILASMIQEETKYLNEFETVSSVFHNRLNNKNTYPYLESDATIMYGIQIATGERPSTLKETTFDTPYNSYKHKGLPPGPIANAGYDAIYCALYPAKTTYYYFVSDKTGVTTFSRTYPEHQAAINRIRSEG